MGGKKSSCILLLAAFAAFLRLGSAEGDPLPPSLVDMVRESPISSIEDLKKLLDTESVEEDSDNQTANEIHSSDGHHRVPRSLMASAEPAQQAACKVRTEVLEVTRSMHDRTNAHFMLWPLCVEVQRCSGCCNSRTSQCVPVITEIRQLQMTKITYVNTRAHFEKVIVPVEDHVRCGCQPLTSPYSNTHTSTARKPQPQPQPQPQQPTTPLPPPQPASRLAHKPAQPQPHPQPQNKEDLHRQDALKHNQRLHLEDQDSQGRLWQSKYSLSHTAGEPRHTPARLDYQAQAQARPARPHTPTYPRTDTHHTQQQQQQQDRRSSSLTHTETPVASEGMERVGRRLTATALDNRKMSGSQHSSPAAEMTTADARRVGCSTRVRIRIIIITNNNSSSRPATNRRSITNTPPPNNTTTGSPSEETNNNRQHGQPTQAGAHMLRDSTHQPQHGSPSPSPSFHHSQSDSPVYRHSQSDMASGHAHVQSEGSSHHSQSEGSSQYDSPSEVTASPRERHEAEEERRRSQIVEELEREKEKEIEQEVSSQRHQDSHHYHHQTSTQKAVTESPSTLRPETTSPRPQTTPKPLPPRPETSQAPQEDQQDHHESHDHGHVLMVKKKTSGKTNKWDPGRKNKNWNFRCSDNTG
ncbi:hypothetical protein ACEWY4_018100 [Coilia grayii]|uniref:Platelet-derived growth factor (PDGF) family profile domain-containing protein n=1 Tax=Coilia grayii TaxID=363190 RepID=A0ABD1JIQ5_9TELE